MPDWCNRRRSRSSSQIISGLFKSKEGRRKPEHLLVNKIECLHLQHLLRRAELAGRDASLALSIQLQETLRKLI
jgi:hypothetical protein